jgi:hypothetical protein
VGLEVADPICRTGLLLDRGDGSPPEAARTSLPHGGSERAQLAGGVVQREAAVRDNVGGPFVEWIGRHPRWAPQADLHLKAITPTKPQLSDGAPIAHTKECHVPEGNGRPCPIAYERLRVIAQDNEVKIGALTGPAVRVRADHGDRGHTRRGRPLRALPHHVSGGAFTTLGASRHRPLSIAGVAPSVGAQVAPNCRSARVLHLREASSPGITGGGLRTVRASRALPFAGRTGAHATCQTAPRDVDSASMVAPIGGDGRDCRASFGIRADG